MDDKHRKLFVIEQSKGCRFMPIMDRNTLGQPGSTGGAYAQWGPTSKGDQREGNERWDGNGGERILPKVNLSRISTAYARTHAQTDEHV